MSFKINETRISGSSLELQKKIAREIGNIWFFKNIYVSHLIFQSAHIPMKKYLRKNCNTQKNLRDGGST